MKNLAERLKAARKEAGLTQPELANQAGVSAGTIGNLESGARKDPRELLAIARAVRVHAEWLKTGKGPRHLDEKADDQPVASHKAPDMLAQYFPRLEADRLDKLTQNQLKGIEDSVIKQVNAFLGEPPKSISQGSKTGT